MKITYPECQIELTAEELIVLMGRINLYEAGARLVQLIESYKLDADENPGQQPEPVSYPKEEEPAPVESKKKTPKRKPADNPKKVDVLFESGWTTFNSVSAAAKAIDARINHLNHALLNGKTCNGYPVRYTEDAPTFEPGGIIGPETEQPASGETVTDGHDLPHKINNTAGRGSRKVDVQMKDGNWVTYDTIKDVAAMLGVTSSHICTSIRKEKPVKGHAVRYHEEMDDIMAEIAASNKKPYQTTPPVR